MFLCQINFDHAIIIPVKILLTIMITLHTDMDIYYCNLDLLL